MRPPPSPPPRQWLPIDYENIQLPAPSPDSERNNYPRGREQSELSGKTLRIFCYNILAESYATPERHGYCPAWALSWVKNPSFFSNYRLMYFVE